MCIFFREDNKERVTNLLTIIQYYADCSNIAEVIVYYEVTDPESPIINRLCDMNCNVIVSRGRADGWNKSVGYNKCAALARTPILCFNDVDVVVDYEQIRITEEYLMQEPAAGLIYPFDGRFLCVDKELKKEFISDLHTINHEAALQLLQAYEPRTAKINDRSRHVFVGHNNSPGGIVMCRRDNFIRFGGYNPNFIGWGYEDSEILSRVRILGFKCGRATNKPVWHLDHTDENSSKKETQKYHEKNRQECAAVESMTQQQLLEYINTWNII